MLSKVSADACSPLRPLTNRRHLSARTTATATAKSASNGDSAPARVSSLASTTSTSELMQRALLTEPCLTSLAFDTLLSLSCLSKSWHALCAADDENATIIWRIVCINFAQQHGLFCPRSGDTGIVSCSEWRRVFVDDLWPARKKWQNDSLTQHQADNNENSIDFKIKVAVRFRACEDKASEKKLELPLHQLLKLRRHQQNGVGNEKSTKKKRGCHRKPIAFGGRRNPPSHLRDAMTSNLLVQPRRFPSSQKVMDLKAIRPMLKHNPYDPFDGTPCTLGDLLLCPDIEAELVAWHSPPTSGSQVGVAGTGAAGGSKSTRGLNEVGIDAVRKMAEAGAELSPEVLEMLLDAEQLQQQLQQAEANAQRQENSNKHRCRDGSVWINSGETSVPDSNWNRGETNDVPHLPPTQGIGATGQGLSDVASPSDVSMSKKTLPTPSLDHQHQHRKRDQPRLLSVQKSRVNFFVPGTGVRKFHFPRCFDGTATQCQVYSQCARSAVLASLNGISSCVLSYGQTGSGKTYTQFGPEGWTKTLEKELRNGLSLTSSGCVIRGIVDIINAIDEARARRDFSLATSATYTQVYNNRISDLLTGRPCSVARETGEILGAQEVNISSMADAVEVLREGEQRKTFEATAMNGRSSRAHTIFALTLRQVRRDGRMVKSNLFFVDLAGSERVKRSKVRGNALTQAIGINQSLSVLGRVIKDLMAGANHVPYLESRLTTLLRQCFGGNCLTRVLVSCRSDQSHSEESLNSLRFGERCSRICNQVVFATSSVSAALAQVDEALAAVDHGLAVMQERARQDGSGTGGAMKIAWAKLRQKKEMLCLKRKDLQKLAE